MEGQGVRKALRHALRGVIAGFNRSGVASSRLELVAIDGNRLYNRDGLLTYHAHPFLDDPAFRRAYARAVRAGGHDYDIPWRVHTILWAAQHALRLDGAFVECGTGRGFMASAICEYLGWGERPFLLFDTFVPYALDEDGRQRPGSTTLDVYADSPESVAANFAEWPGIELVVGRVPEAFDERPVPRVAFLHVDLNHPPAEIAAVRHIWPHLVPGGVVVFDDYGFGSSETLRAQVDELASEFGVAVHASPTGQGLMLK